MKPISKVFGRRTYTSFEFSATSYKAIMSITNVQLIIYEAIKDPNTFRL
jgi:hypothetical protein